MGMGRPSRPAVDPQLAAQRRGEQERLAREEAENRRRREEEARLRRENLIGQRSLQDEEIIGYQGFRQRPMQMGKSIRS